MYFGAAVLIEAFKQKDPKAAAKLTESSLCLSLIFLAHIKSNQSCVF